MQDSQYLEKAKGIIKGVRGKQLSFEERREASIELAGCLLKEARRSQTLSEFKISSELGRMMDDPLGKSFTVAVTDECFRTNRNERAADQLEYLIEKFGIPKFLKLSKKFQLFIFKFFGKSLPSLLIPLVKRLVRKEASHLIIPGERRPLSKHMQMRKSEGVRINLNKLGEALLGEREAEKRLIVYLADLANPEVEYISVKISTLYSQINLVAKEHTLRTLQEKLKILYREAGKHIYTRKNGERVFKFVNLDMEEYRDLHLTVDLFKATLDEPEFFQHAAGIVLQSYLPESFLIQQELTVWAMQRVARGGAPIKIRIVKGANLAMERVDASRKGYPQAPYLSKCDVDANYKRMLNYASLPHHAAAVRVGVASHNIFDIAYALLLRSESMVEDFVEFEMLEGMAEPIRKVVQKLTGGMLLYCPAAKEDEFINAVAYFVRRLDENTSPDNFLRHLFKLIPGTREWQNLANQFSLACHAQNAAALKPRRTQNRMIEESMHDIDSPFRNEPDTDWSLPQNQKWIQNILSEWERKELEDIPLVLGGKKITESSHYAKGFDPSCPGAELYGMALADSSQIDFCIKEGEKAFKKWSETPVKERSQKLWKTAHLFKESRGALIGAMVADGAKIVEEGDQEVSEAIDFIEYYRRNLEEITRYEGVRWKSKGSVLVTSPWNFPCSIPTGGIAAALAAGNTVIFKPAMECAYVGWKLVNLFWEGGIPREVLQFILCEDETGGSQLVQDPRVASIVLTGSTETAKKMLKMRPGINLIAETGGKNPMIITSLSDRELAVKDLVHSAFSHAGQKCSACSLGIVLSEVYDDLKFREMLFDRASSLIVGSAWNLSSRVTPLIREPNEALARALTSLEEGEEWLLQPKQDPENPMLWSPGIKMGVRKGSFTYETELFGPVLGIMRAESLEEAIVLANGTRYGLTSGIHTLDEREKNYWMDHIEAGNCYVNRGITGAVVVRQPFGGCKESSFGPGAKAGGPNYLMQLLSHEDASLPEKLEPASGVLTVIGMDLEKMGILEDGRKLWDASVGSYAYYWKHYFSKSHDPSLILGQDNILKYAPRKSLLLRVNSQDFSLNVMRVVAASCICGVPLVLSGDINTLSPIIGGEWRSLAKNIQVLEETESEFIERIKKEGCSHIRFLSTPSLIVKKVLAEMGSSVIVSLPSVCGRVEVLKFLREVSFSIDYHRHGNLGQRESETRSVIF